MKLNRQMTNLLTRLKTEKLSRIAWAGISFSTIGFLNVLGQSATANDYIGNKGIQFKEDTMIEFEFIESHGAYQSTFGVIDLDSCQTTIEGGIVLDSCDKTPLLVETKPSDTYESVSRRSTYEDNLERSNYDFLGTPGNAVPQSMAKFTFKTGRRYAFYLESYYENQLAGVVYSVDFFNNQTDRQALFNETIPTTQLVTRRNIPDREINQFESLVSGGLLLRFDDTGLALVKDGDQDFDFDDFVVGIGGYESCICPEKRAQN